MAHKSGKFRNAERKVGKRKYGRADIEKLTGVFTVYYKDQFPPTVLQGGKQFCDWLDVIVGCVPISYVYSRWIYFAKVSIENRNDGISWYLTLINKSEERKG